MEENQTNLPNTTPVTPQSKAPTQDTQTQPASPSPQPTPQPMPTQQIPEPSIAPQPIQPTSSTPINQTQPQPLVNSEIPLGPGQDPKDVSQPQPSIPPQQPPPTSSSTIDPNQINTTNESEASPPPKNKSGKGIIIIAIFVLILVLSGSFVGISLADAYEKINFTHSVTTQVGNTLISTIPFLPETAQMVIEKSIQAHEVVSTANFKASLATESQSLSQFLGSSDIDIIAEGQVDWTDKENPQGQIDLNISNQFKAKGVVIPDKFYFQINQIPQAFMGIISAYLGADPSAITNAYLNKWIFIDQSSPENEARNSLNNTKDTSTDFDEKYQQVMETLYQEDIKDKLFIEETQKDGMPVFHISLKLEDQDINTIIETLAEVDEDFKNLNQDISPSDVIQQISLDSYINQDTYYLHTFTLSLNFNNQAIIDSYASQGAGVGALIEPEEFRIAMSLQLSNVGENINIQAPKDSLPLEDFIARITRVMSRTQETTMTQIPAELDSNTMQ